MVWCMSGKKVQNTHTNARFGQWALGKEGNPTAADIHEIFAAPSLSAALSETETTTV